MKLGIAVMLLLGTMAFACPPPKPKPPVPPTPVPVVTNSNINTNTATSASNSSAISASSASSNQSQGQQQGQTQTAGGNGSNNNSTETKMAASAISPPILPSAPCIKGAGGAVQAGMIGGSFGAGKVDQGCDDRELARSFSGPQTVASCKILLNTKKAKKAGITMEDCLGKPLEPVVVTQYVEVPEPVAPVVIIEQAPLVLPQAPVVIPKLKRKVVRHLRPDCQNEVIRVCK